MRHSNKCFFIFPLSGKTISTPGVVHGSGNHNFLRNQFQWLPISYYMKAINTLPAFKEYITAFMAHGGIGIVPQWNGDGITYGALGEVQIPLEPLVSIPYTQVHPDVYIELPGTKPYPSAPSKFKPTAVSKQYGLFREVSKLQQLINSRDAKEFAPDASEEDISSLNELMQISMTAASCLEENMNILCVQEETATFLKGLVKTMDVLFSLHRPSAMAMLAEVGLLATTRAEVVSSGIYHGVKDILLESGSMSRQAVEEQMEKTGDSLLRWYTTPSPAEYKTIAARAWVESFNEYTDENTVKFRQDRALHSAWNSSHPIVFQKLLGDSMRWNYKRGYYAEAAAGALRVGWAILNGDQFGEQERVKLYQHLVIARDIFKVTNIPPEVKMEMEILTRASKELPLNEKN